MFYIESDAYAHGELGLSRGAIAFAVHHARCAITKRLGWCVRFSFG